MRLWRLSGIQFAESMDGGYGLHFDGRWNRIGHPVTYCSTSPSLCVLEELVHVEDFDLLPPLAMVAYDAPDGLQIQKIGVQDLPADWRFDENMTQEIGSHWHGEQTCPLLQVPSAIMPIAQSPDVNVVINHRHPDAAAIRIASIEPFTLDVRLVRS